MAVDNPTVLRSGLKVGTGSSSVAISAILDEDNFASNSAEAVPTQQSVKALFDTLSSSYNRRNKVITIATSTSAPPTEVSGDRYILDNSGAPHANWDGASQGDIVEFNGTTWDATTPNEGWIAYCDTDNKDALCVDDGTLQWELRDVAVTNHNDLSAINGGTSGEYYHMTSAQHTSIVGGSSDASSLHHHDGRYYTESEVDALLPADGTAAGQMLHWSGSAWANTEVSELYFDDTNKRLGVGTSSPAYGIHNAGDDGSEGSIGTWRASTDTGNPSFQFRKSRGTVASPADVETGDYCGAIVSNVRINSAWDSVGEADFIVVGTHTTYCSADFTIRLQNSSNSLTERMRLTSAGYLGIGTDEPAYGIDCSSEDTSASTIMARRFNASGNGAIFRAYSARGTQATPTAKQDNDTLGNLVFGGYDGSSWEQGAVILSTADGLWSDTNFGADIEFHMCQNNATTLTQRFVMESTGAFYMDQTSAPGTTTDRLYNVSGDLYWNAVKLNNDLSGYVDTSGTPANDQIAVFTDANTIEGDSDFIWDGTSLGIGTTSPIQGIEMVSEGSTQATNRGHIQIKAHKTTGDNINSSAWFCSFKANGTIAAPTDLASGDSIGGFQAIGYDESTWKELGRIHWYADDTPGAGSTYIPGRCEIYTYDNSAEGGKWTFDHEGAITFKEVTAPSTTTNKLYNTSTGLYFDGVRLDIDSTTDSRLTSGTAAGQLLFWDGTDSWDPTETTEMVWDDTNKRLGLGTASPDYMLEIVSASAPYFGISYYAANTTSSSVVLRKARGTEGTPADVVADDGVGTLAGNAWIGGAYDRIGDVRFLVNDVHTTYASGYISFRTSDTSGNFEERLRVEEDGAILFPDMTAPGTTTNRLYNTTTGLFFDGVRLDIDSTTDSRLTSGTAAGQILFWDGTDSYDPTETSEMVWDDTNKRLGIGTASPVQILELAADASLYPTISGYGAGTLDELVLRNANGTQASPANSANGDNLGSIAIHGYHTSDWRESVRLETTANSATMGAYIPGNFKIRVYNDTTTGGEWDFDHEGALKIKQVSAPSVTTDKLYNVSGGLYWNGTQLGTSNVTDGTAAGQILFWDGTDSYDPTETTEMFWDDTNKRLGIGTSSPEQILELAADASLYPKISGYGTGNLQELVIRHARGTQASPTAVANDDSLGSIAIHGYYNSDWRESVRLETYANSATMGAYIPGRFKILVYNSTTEGGAWTFDHEGAVEFKEVSAPSTTTNKLYNTSTGLYFDGTRLDIDSTTDSRLTSGTAAGQLLFWDGTDSWDPTETTEMVWDDTNKYLGVGADATPEARITVVGDSGDGWQKSSIVCRHYDNTENGSYLVLSKADGSVASPAAIDQFDRLGYLVFQGHDGNSFANGAKIEAVAAENWVGGTNRGTSILIQTVASGATTPADAAWFHEDKSFGLAQTSTPSSTADKLYNVSGNLYWDGTQLNTSADSRLTSGTAAGQMLFWDGSDSWDPTETSELFWDDTNKRLGIGDTAPYSAIELQGDSQAASSITMTAASDSEIPFAMFRRSGGTTASRTASSVDDVLGGLHASAWINSAWDSACSIRMAVEGTHTTYVSSYIAFQLQNSSNSNAERVRFESGGGIKLSTLGKVYADSIDMTIATETSGNIKLDSAGEIHFDDGNISGWTQGYMKFSNASSEWTDFETNFGGEVSLLSAINQAYENASTAVSNTDVDTGTEDVDTFADTVAKGASWTYIVSNGTNHRGGIVVASWNATADTVTYTDISTDDQGDTSQLTFSVDISANNVRLRATATSDNWNVEAERKLVAKA